MSRNLRLFFQNATGRLRTIRLEPWACHFLLGPDEKLEIIAIAPAEDASFRMFETIDATLVYIEGCDKVSVIQDDTAHDLLPAYEIEVEPIRSPRMTDNPMFDCYIDST